MYLELSFTKLLKKWLISADRNYSHMYYIPYRIDIDSKVKYIIILYNQYPFIDKKFLYLKKLKRIALPPNIVIKSIAFTHCAQLDNVVIPKHANIIENYTFSGCKSLKNIILSNELVSIREGAFLNCSSLETIKIPDSVKFIGSHAFGGCLKLKNVTFPKNISEISFQSKIFIGCKSLSLENLDNDVKDKLLRNFLSIS